MKNMLILAALALTMVLAGCSIDKSSLAYNQFTFQWSDGNCTSAAQCKSTEFGCGGGHTMCTSNPEKFKGMLSTCEMVENHPSDQGFRCACVTKEKKCGWVK